VSKACRLQFFREPAAFSKTAARPLAGTCDIRCVETNLPLAELSQPERQKKQAIVSEFSHRILISKNAAGGDLEPGFGRL
jgi:hypothetical protein